MQNLPQPKTKSGKVICLRPEKDFIDFKAIAPDHLEVLYLAPDKSDLIDMARDAQALLIPAVGPKISNNLFLDTSMLPGDRLISGNSGFVLSVPDLSPPTLSPSIIFLAFR